MNKRPAVPMEIQRKVKLEAGHRCAIPTCKQTPVELAHIIAYHKVQEHTFENLIALCPTCHTRYDNGDIDKKSMEQYKANLSIINARYNDFEKRVLETINNQENKDIQIPGGLEMMVSYLLKDKLLKITAQSGIIMNGIPSYYVYSLTDKGQKFLDKWLSGNTLE